METGGKNATIVWDDCNYEKALYDTVLSSFLTAGQRCLSSARVLVHEKIFDRFTEDFHNLAKKCRVDYGFVEGEKAPFMGPLISEASTENYLRYQGIAVREGCEEVMRGKTLERDKKGYYVSPSIHWVKTRSPKAFTRRMRYMGPMRRFSKSAIWMRRPKSSINLNTVWSPQFTRVPGKTTPILPTRPASGFFTGTE